MKQLILFAVTVLMATGCQGEITGDWRKLGTVEFAGEYLDFHVETDQECCGTMTEQGGSPVKLYFARFQPEKEKGRLCILGNQDAVVVLEEQGSGWFSKELYRSTDPAQRYDDFLVIRVPTNKLPDPPFRVWSATDIPVTLMVGIDPTRGKERVYPYIELVQHENGT